ncbi:hypothetical protein D4R42_05075 [bacterium]|nr:MAG: hypothetical protein D4R42_05075 [bacterium]
MADVILTNQEAEDLRVTVAGKHLMEELEVMLTKCRLQVDEIDQNRLPALQGRISALKDILSLLG